MTENKDKKVLNVPNIRFPEFKEEWKKQNLESITSSVSSGKSHAADGEYNLYGSTGIIGKTDNGAYEGNLVLVARVGANAGYLQIINEKCGITDNTLVITPRQISARYIYNYLQHFNLNCLIFGSGQPLITGSMLKNVSISFGTYEEQNKIATFLSLLDERIATQNKIIEELKQLKNGIIEKQYKNVFNNCRLGDVIKQTSIRNKNKAITNILSVNNKLGFINQREQFEDRIIASDDISNYKIVEKKHFAYNPARINVGSIAQLKTFESGIVSPMYICFKTQNNIDSDYLEYYFSTLLFKKEVQKRLEGSVRLCLSYESLCNIPFFVPNIDEQKRISRELSLLSSKINIEDCYLSILEKQKQYLLRQMFI